MNTDKYDRSELLSAAEIEERGWYDSMIRALLGEPDDTRANPHQASSRRPMPRMRFWLASRVVAAEASEEFAERREKARKRSVVGQAKAAAASPLGAWLPRKAHPAVQKMLGAIASFGRPFSMRDLHGAAGTAFGNGRPDRADIKRLVRELEDLGLIRCIAQGTPPGPGEEIGQPRLYVYVEEA